MISSKSQFFGICGFGVSGLLLVILGAMGAHQFSQALDGSGKHLFETAWRYHSVHTLALGVAALLGFRFSTAFFGLGMLLFSGSLYWVSLGGPAWLVKLTPFGGIALMVGWALVSVGAFKCRGAQAS